jgi:hypothetical protein
MQWTVTPDSFVIGGAIVAGRDRFADLPSHSREHFDRASSTRSELRRADIGSGRREPDWMAGAQI